MKAMRIHRHGGPEEFRREEVELAPPAPGEVRIHHRAIAVNFSDVNLRRGGFYLGAAPAFPLILGNEAVGVLDGGERVAYVGSGGAFYENTGAYAEERNIPARLLVRLPEAIPDRTAAALMLKGLTASMVLHRCYRPAKDDAVLVHAAASGVGLLLVQWLKHLGAMVIGTVGSRAKAQAARAAGCDHIVLYRETDFVAEVRKLAPKGVAAVLDGVGRDTFRRSLDVLRPFGTLVNYGNASGHPEPLDLLLLAKKGSLSVSRPAFSTHVATPEDLRGYSAELFDLMRRGVLKVEVARSYPLSEAARAHADLESRALAGAAVLIP